MRYKIWDDIQRVQEEFLNLNQANHRPGDLSTSPQNNLPGSHIRSPISDIIETRDKIFARIELPGIKKENIELNVSDNKIELRARNDEKKELLTENTERKMFLSNNFQRSIPLKTKIDPALITAEYENGMLKIEIPKINNKSIKKIKID